MATSQSRFDRRFDEEFNREVAALASRLGARMEQVASDLGVRMWPGTQWRGTRQHRAIYSAFSGAFATPTTLAALQRWRLMKTLGYNDIHFLPHIARDTWIIRSD